MSPKANDPLITDLAHQYPHRLDQISRLAAFYRHVSLPTPSAVVVRGSSATGKSYIVRSVLEKHDFMHAVVDSRDCITVRHLFEHAFTACLDTVESRINLDRGSYERCDSIDMLRKHLESLLPREHPFVLVFDGIDKQREAPPTLLPAISRLSEQIPSLSIILIAEIPLVTQLQTANVQSVDFPSYTRDEAIEIVARRPQSIVHKSWPESMPVDMKIYDAQIWELFLAPLWETLAENVARDVVSFKELADKLWPAFVQPIQDGHFSVTDSYARLITQRRHVFTDYSALEDSLLLPGSDEDEVKTTVAHELPGLWKKVLCAAYPASFNSSSTDWQYFGSRADGKKHRKLAGERTKGMTAPSAFTLDRFIFIYRSMMFSKDYNDHDLGIVVKTLEKSGLLVASGATSAESQSRSLKWKVKYSFDFASAMGTSVEVQVANYLAGMADR